MSPGTLIKSSFDDLCDVYEEKELCKESNLTNLDHSLPLIDKVKNLEIRAPSNSDLGFESVAASSSNASKSNPVEKDQKWQCSVILILNFVLKDDISIIFL